MRILPPALLLTALAAPVAAQNSDSAYAGVLRRGATVMGVDQDASRHVFEDLPDGGRIIFAMRDTADATGMAAIRAHLRTIAGSFAEGRFTDPAAVHAMEVPGTRVMAARRDQIQYAMTERPGGGEVRITTADPVALAAVHQFLAFQRMDHRAPGSESDHRHGAHQPSGHQPTPR